MRCKWALVHFSLFRMPQTHCEGISFYCHHTRGGGVYRVEFLWHKFGAQFVRSF